MPAPPIIANDPTLAAHIAHYCPDAEGEELAQRVALLKGREWAAALRGRSTNSLADQFACHAHEVAGRFVFRLNESEARLALAAQLCRALVRAAMAADSLDCEDTPL
jgi:hypothetical protein